MAVKRDGAEERQGRQQVDEGRHRLGGVEERPQAAEKRSLRAARMPRTRPMTSVRTVATRTVASVCHAVLPHLERDDQRQADRRRDRPPAGR